MARLDHKLVMLPKSTVLEALDIFFNESKGVIKLDKNDINKEENTNENKEITISVVFEDLPEGLILDETSPTTLKAEYLLNSEDKLEVIKKYPNAGTEKVYIKANHPSNEHCSNLLEMKLTELKGIIGENKIECSNQTKKAVMRKAIWEHFKDDLNIKDKEIDVKKEDAKQIWEKLKDYMPIYVLFQSDRKNSDGDSEVQDPMKLAVKEMLKESELKNELKKIASKVDKKLQSIANATLEKLKEMNPDIANKLNPVIPPVESLKWADVFKNVTISSDEGIPINKRGSGIKRLILLNFFRAEAERRKDEKKVTQIIYAIEEPETSQHPNHQKELIEAFKKLSQTGTTQVILTTHSPSVVKMLSFSDIRLITEDNQNKKTITNIKGNELPYPSLNEVNYLAFNESDEEYHNELYGFIEGEEWLSEYKKEIEGTKREYTREKKNGKTTKEEKTLSEYIRHKIHHPENKHNKDYTRSELQESLKKMREFIVHKRKR